MTIRLTRRDLLKSVSGLPAVAAVGGLASLGTEAAEAPQERDRVVVRNPAHATIDRSLQQAVANGTVAGVVAMGATQRGVIYEGAFGHANLQTGAAMTPDTVFWLLSMTKAITATACMQLVEQGKLRLDQPASEILPQLKAPQVLEGFDAAPAEAASCQAPDHGSSSADPHVRLYVQYLERKPQPLRKGDRYARHWLFDEQGL
jgi:methyl acetate hydrolase